MKDVVDCYDDRKVSAPERRRERLRKHADRLLKEVLRRAHPNIEDRERIAAFLEGVVAVEVLYRAGGGGEC